MKFVAMFYTLLLLSCVLLFGASALAVSQGMLPALLGVGVAGFLSKVLFDISKTLWMPVCSE